MPSSRSGSLSAFGTVLLLCLATMQAQDESAMAAPYPPDAPEHQALTAASPSLGDEKFSLRQEYWKGALTTSAGTAVKLQFFKGNTYRLFFGVSPSNLVKGAKLQLHVFNEKSEEVSSATGEPGKAALALHFENNLKTGLYLILMRVEMPRGPIAETEIPAVLFYGWQ